MGTLSRESEAGDSSQWQRYIVATACALIALPMIFFRGVPAAEVNLRLIMLAGVMFSSWFGGFGPGLVTTVLASFTIINSNSSNGIFSSIDSTQSVRLVEFIIVALMITYLNDRRRKAQHRAEMAQTEAEVANRTKDEFLATISHELRSPLTAVIGWTELLRREKNDRFRSEALDVIQQNATKQLQLIEDLLDMSQVKAGRLLLDTRPTDLARVVENAIGVVRPALEAKALQLRTHIEDGPKILADDRRLQQVVWNLLSNAVKFTPEGGLINVVVKYTDSQALIIVRDNGIGIDSSFVPQLFERFRQGDLSGKRYGGLGLGLAIARDLVELHGGTIDVESRGKGQGAKFVIKLPLTNAERKLRVMESGALVSAV